MCSKICVRYVKEKRESNFLREAYCLRVTLSNNKKAVVKSAFSYTVCNTIL